MWNIFGFVGKWRNKKTTNNAVSQNRNDDPVEPGTPGFSGNVSPSSPPKEPDSLIQGSTPTGDEDVNNKFEFPQEQNVDPIPGPSRGSSGFKCGLEQTGELPSTGPSSSIVEDGTGSGNEEFVNETRGHDHQEGISGPRPRPNLVCDHCQKTFCNPRSLKEHQMKLRGERPFICTQCSASYVTMSALKYHSAIHTGVRPFKCTYCNMDFVYVKALEWHLKKHTKPKQPKSYRCPICQKRFARKFYLKNHTLLHTGE